MEPMTLGFITQSTAGELTGPPAAEVASVCTDTRDIRPGCLFIALKGERFDGHDFAAKAARAGAAAILAHKPVEADAPVILVKDTGRALLALAAAYRARFPIPSVGVTGSVGKTSTREMVHAVLSQKYKTHENEGNRNNLIGMPLAVFGLEKSHEAAVFEMGMSAFGEISALAKVARPHVGIITNIGISHIEKLGSREGILKAKLEILDGLDPGGTLILNGDDPLLAGAAKTLRRPVLLFGVTNPACDYRAADIRMDGGRSAFVIEGPDGKTKAALPVIGIHQVYNALAAFAAGRVLGVPAERAAEGLGRFETVGQRQRMTDWHGATLVEDCYNASPDSMRAAFSVLSIVKAQRRIAVLADMLELGEKSEEAHLAVGALAAENGVDLLYAFGAEARRYCEGFRGRAPERPCVWFNNRDALAQQLRRTVRPGDAVLFKGSRGMHLEEAIAAFQA